MISTTSTQRLTDSPVGTRARLHSTALSTDDRALLQAMGLTSRCTLRIRKQGEPMIVQVGRTRIGISRRLADRIFVDPPQVPGPPDPIDKG